MYDVYFTCIDDDGQVLHVQQDQNTWNTIQDHHSIFSFEQWSMNNEKAKKLNENKSRTKDEQTRMKLKNQKKNYTIYWHTSIMHNTINHECLYWNRLKCDHSSLHRVQKYPCDYGTDNYNPIWPGINSETSQATEGLVLTQQSSSQKPFM